MTFREAVAGTRNMETAWRHGLKALRPRDRPQIRAQNTRLLRGSADVDTALLSKEPRANRWDYAIGYQRTNRRGEFIYWVETHTGSDDLIKAVLRKLKWLKIWMQDAPLLASFERDIIWVSSGHTLFTKGSTQVKTLAQQGLIYSGATLRIPNERPA